MGAECLFCKIVAGGLPAQKVFEDDQVIAFKDINPQAPTHLLIIPKKHIPSLAAAQDADAAILGYVQLVARDLAKQGGLSDGFRLVANNGRGAGQTVDHIHYHLLAGRRLTWPPG
ncbi:MAG: histidine triad nucleotide-binding protein [Elusimicrobia bacterium]|nr:histidine triad nucleotide-binding protein [Elusimicrobiota bacterium]